MLPGNTDSLDFHTLSPPPHVFFLHVPKTGGITLGSYLQTLFASDLICPQPTGNGRWIYTADEVAKYRLFNGHFDIDFINRVNPNGIKLTILRDPLSRIVSIYDFWRSISLDWANQNLAQAEVNAPLFARNNTFSELLRTDNHFVREAIENATARQLLGRRYADLASDKKAAVKAAFAQLNSFDWYTTTDNLSSALPVLATRMGAAAPHNLHLHRTYTPEANEPRVPVQRTDPSVDDLRYCAQINQIDLELYRMATEAAAPRGRFGDVIARLRGFFRKPHEPAEPLRTMWS